MGPPILPFSISGDIFPGFQGQSGYPCLHTSLPVCDVPLNIDTYYRLLVANMAAELLTHILFQAMVRVEPPHAACY